MEEKEQAEKARMEKEREEEAVIHLADHEARPSQLDEEGSKMDRHMPGPHPGDHHPGGAPIPDVPPQKGKHLKKWQKLKKKQDKPKFGKYLLIVCVTALLLVGGFFGARLAIRQANLRETGISSEQCIGMNYTEIKELLNTAGFENLHILAVEDLEYSDLAREGEVLFLAVEDRTSFRETDRFDKNADVFLLYHSAKAVTCPLDMKEAAALSLEEAGKAFLDAGFVNVELVPVPDLVFGWLHKDGEIKSITIDGQGNIMAGTPQRVDSEVVISYHTFKEK